MNDIRELFTNEEAREITKQIYAGMADAAVNAANNVRISGRWTVKVGIKALGDVSETDLNMFVNISKDSEF